MVEARGAKGRYVCAESTLQRGAVVRPNTRQALPGVRHPLKVYLISSSVDLPSIAGESIDSGHRCRCKDDVNPPRKGYKFASQKLKDLAVAFVPAKQCLSEAVKSLQEKGLRPIIL